MTVMRLRVLNLCGPLALLLALTMSGCTAVVSPHVSESEFLSAQAKKRAQIQIYVSDEFRNYKNTQTDAMDMKKWEYELGPVTVDSLKYALASRFTSVELKLGTPTFPVIEETPTEDWMIVVDPAFAQFDAHYPIVFKFEKYTAEIALRVRAFQKNGALLLDKTYQGKGSQSGAIGMESGGHAANPVAVKLAIKEAVNQAVADIAALVAHP